MCAQAANREPTIRSHWLFETVQECQRFACTVEVAACESRPVDIGKLVDRLPTPDTPAERLALTLLLANTTLHALGQARRSGLSNTASTELRSRESSLVASVALDSDALQTCVRSLRGLSPLLPVVTKRGSTANRAKGILDVEFMHPLRVRDLAPRLACHPRQLQRLFKIAFEVSIHRYLRSVRVNEGLRLLAETDDKVEAIALATGFRSRSAFSAAVRQVAGTTPAEWRRHIRGRVAVE